MVTRGYSREVCHVTGHRGQGSLITTRVSRSLAQSHSVLKGLRCALRPRCAWVLRLGHGGEGTEPSGGGTAASEGGGTTSRPHWLTSQCRPPLPQFFAERKKTPVNIDCAAFCSRPRFGLFWLGLYSAHTLLVCVDGIKVWEHFSSKIALRWLLHKSTFWGLEWFYVILFSIFLVYKQKCNN